MTKQGKKTNSKGFTLIELLIVIIIIGILAAIAFVAYSGSQNKAHKADAQSTLSEVRNKLGEYNADNSNYPANIAAVDAWMTSAAGGNNSTLAAKFVGPDYTYTASPSGCDNGAGGDCTGYSTTAKGTIFGGASPADDITVTN
ncbi:MAG TPA: prepilin-type N-terminal cleavage/methylation domain-containing protein [Patescibacteria group bacterium]|nr:prepilin-type N-terminal cleavage/methylation domain-containing protein [Patescibacteria group bacterium]